MNALAKGRGSPKTRLAAQQTPGDGLTPTESRIVEALCCSVNQAAAARRARVARSSVTRALRRPRVREAFVARVREEFGDDLLRLKSGFGEGVAVLRRAARGEKVSQIQLQAAQQLVSASLGARLVDVHEVGEARKLAGLDADARQRFRSLIGLPSAGDRAPNLSPSAENAGQGGDSASNGSAPPHASAPAIDVEVVEPGDGDGDESESA